MPTHPDQVLADLVRDEVGLVVAGLYRRTRDFDLAEEAVQEAVVAALRHWRTDGVPDRPGAWLTVTAQRKATDLLRRRQRTGRLVEQLAGDLAEDLAEETAIGAGPVEPDERIPMLFGCCHPALRVESRLALTLRAVVGMTTPQIAEAFLVSGPTMAQRLVRAKRKITSTAIPFVVPTGPERAARLDDVLTVIYLAYNAGYLDRDAGQLASDAVWLAELVARELPDEAEAWGLLALLTWLSARTPARFAADGSLILLADQDRSRWDRVAMARADGYLERAARLGRPGRFQLQAAIAACHADAPIWAATDWLQILTLYDLLLQHDSSPVVRLNHAIALAQVRGPRDGLTALDGLGGSLAGYHLWHASRARLLAELGDHDLARAADRQALALATNPVEQELLVSRLRE